MMTKPTIPEVLPLVQAYYAEPENSCGGSLHLVLDDNNISDHDVEYCLAGARACSDTPGVELAELLLRMSRTQRLKLAKMH